MSQLPSNLIRSATLARLHELLDQQSQVKDDRVVAAEGLRLRDGFLIVGDAAELLSDQGVSCGPGRYALTDTALAGIGRRLDIPTEYLRRIHGQNRRLCDAMVNHGLNRSPDRFLIRSFRQPGNPTGVTRAFVSKNFNPIDHQPVLAAALAGITASDVAVSCEGSLTEQRMYLNVTAETVALDAGVLLAGFRHPFTGANAADDASASAGFVVDNSETAEGRVTITPRIAFRIGRTAITFSGDAYTRVHLGRQLPVGRLRWDYGTERDNLDLITSRVKQAAREFLTIEYLGEKIAPLQRLARRPVRDLEATVTGVCKALRHTPDQRAVVLDCAVRSGADTAGGIMHAVASAAALQDPDTRHQMEDDAPRALALAARR